MPQPQSRPPPHFFWLIFLEPKKLFLWNPRLTATLWWTVMSWCHHTSNGPRVSGSQAPPSIKGQASGPSPGYWAIRDRGPSHASSFGAILGQKQACFEFRAKPQFPSEHRWRIWALYKECQLGLTQAAGWVKGWWTEFGWVWGKARLG